MNFDSDTLISIGANALCGYAAAALLTPHEPIAGAIFGASAGITYTLINPWIESIPDAWLGGCGCASLAKAALSFFASIFVGAVVTSLFGYPITILTGMVLTLSSAITMFAFSYLYNCCLMRCVPDMGVLGEFEF